MYVSNRLKTIKFETSKTVHYILLLGFVLCFDIGCDDIGGSVDSLVPRGLPERRGLRGPRAVRVSRQRDGLQLCEAPVRPAL